MESVDQSSAGKLPRSRRQISDVHKTLCTSADTDDLVLMMERCKSTETGQHQFVRSVQAAHQPLCVLSTYLQLKQIQQCCTDPECFSIFSVEPT